MRCSTNLWTCSGDVGSQGISRTRGFVDLAGRVGVTESIESILGRRMEKQRVHDGYIYRIVLVGGMRIV
jgi:hypothetical protein